MFFGMDTVHCAQKSCSHPTNAYGKKKIMYICRRRKRCARVEKPTCRQSGINIPATRLKLKDDKESAGRTTEEEKTTGRAYVGVYNDFAVIISREKRKQNIATGYVTRKGTEDKIMCEREGNGEGGI